MLNCVYTVYTLTDLTGADVVLRHAAGAAFWSSRGVDFDLGTAQSLERGARGLHETSDKMNLAMYRNLLEVPWCPME